MALGNKKFFEDISRPLGQNLASAPIESPNPSIAYPIGTTAYITATLIESNTKAKASFVIPEDTTTFTALTTVSCNPANSTSSEFRTSSTYLLTYGTILSSGVIKDALYWTPLILIEEDTPAVYPQITSVHFGTEDTGSDYRTHTTDGSFTIIFAPVSTADSNISIEILHIISNQEE